MGVSEGQLAGVEFEALVAARQDPLYSKRGLGNFICSHSGGNDHFAGGAFGGRVMHSPGSIGSLGGGFFVWLTLTGAGSGIFYRPRWVEVGFLLD